MLKIANREFKSRLMMRSSQYHNLELMLRLLEASGTEMVTVSIRRLDVTKQSTVAEALRAK